jgi:hypothetical protein
MGWIDRLEPASDQKYCGQGIHNQQEKEVEDIDKLNHQVAFGLIQNRTGSRSFDDDKHAQQEKNGDSQYPLID